MTERSEIDLLGAEVSADGTPGDHDRRLARYAVAKTRQQLLVDHIVSSPAHLRNLKKEYGQLVECGEFLVFRHYYLIQQYKLKAGCTCKKHLLCALCAIRRAAKCIAIYDAKLDEVTAEALAAGQEYDQIFITFTVKNGPDLKERFIHLQKSLSELLQKRRNALKKRPTATTTFKHVAGAFYSYETTYNEIDESWHPHIHMVALVPKGIFKYVKLKPKKRKAFRSPVQLHDDLVKDWKEITGDSFVIDTRLIEDKDDKLSALVETFKYAVKASELGLEEQITAYMVLRGRRLIGSMGALFGVKLPVNLNDDLLPGEEPYIDIVYQYGGSMLGYQEVDTTNLLKDEKNNLALAPDGQTIHRETGEVIAPF